MSNAYFIVREFEARVAEFAGAKYGVAVDCCTNAIFLAWLYEHEHSVMRPYRKVALPARTYVSVPFAVQRAGYEIAFTDWDWRGCYPMFYATREGDPLPIADPIQVPVWDAAKRFHRGMYEGGFYCLSFHIKKHLPIGRGGMILTDDGEAASWFKRMRYDGREEKPYPDCNITEAGYHMYMTPEQAARGLALMDVLPSDNLPDLTEDYPDLRNFPVFKNEK